MISGGTIFAQMLSMLLSPIITRLYTPEEFGTLSLYVSILTIIIFSTTFSYDVAIPVADDEKKAVNILSLCTIILFLSTIILTIILFFFGESLLNYFNANSLVKYKYLMPLGFFTTGFYTSLSQWTIRKKDFKSISITKYSQSITGNITKIILGYLSLGTVGLLAGQILKSGAGISTLLKPVLINDRNLIKNVSVKNIKNAAKRYMRFPLYTAPTKLLLSLSTHLPFIFISGLYSTSIVGLYSLANIITFLPTTLVSQSVGDVFLGEAASIGKNNAKRIKELYNKLLKKLILIVSVPMIILIIFGPILFAFVFGQNWYEAGVYSRILTIYMFSYFIFHPSSGVFYIFEKQNLSLFLNIINISVVLITFGAAKIFSLSSYTTVLFFSVGKSFVEIIRYFLIQKILNDSIKMEN